MNTGQTVSRNGKPERPRRDADGSPHRPWDYRGSGERLTAAQERELALRIRAGSRDARERMISANIPLVVSVVRQYGSPYLETEDLIQEGMLGLCTAVSSFDPARGCRFSTYATYWIRQRVLRAIDRQGRLIRLPVDVACAARKAGKQQEQLAQQLGREPTAAELAAGCGVSARRLQAVLDYPDEPLSLEACMSSETGLAALDLPDHAQPDPETALIQDEQLQELERLLDTLPERDRAVLEARFGFDGSPVTLTDLGARLKMSREGVRQLERRALQKLRRMATESALA